LYAEMKVIYLHMVHLVVSRRKLGVSELCVESKTPSDGMAADHDYHWLNLHVDE
jgi:hypothetical protein